MRAILFGLLVAALLTKAVDAQQAAPPWLPGAQFDVKQPPGANEDALARSSASRMLLGCKLFVAVPDPNVKTTLKMAGEEGYCSGIIHGLRFMMHFFNDYLPDELRSCPDNAVDGQIAQAVIVYIERNPQRMPKYPFEVLALEAIHEAWPCR